MALMLAASLVGNCTVLILVQRYKKLRYRSVLVSLGLVFADILMSSVWIFQGEAYTIAGKWPFADTGCSIFAYFYLTLLFVRWGEVLAVTQDRFCQILFPFWYQRWSKVLLITSTSLAWALPALVSLPMSILGLTAPYLSLTACSVNCGDDGQCISGIITLFGFFILIGSLVPTVMYIMVYLYGWYKKTAMRKILQLGTGEGIPRNKHGGSAMGFIIMNTQERTALNTCFLVFITNVLTNIPLYITSSLRNREEIYQQIPTGVHFLITYIFLLGTILDPIVVMRTKDFRGIIHQFFSRRKKMRKYTISKGLQNVIPLGITAESLATGGEVLSSTNDMVDESF